MQLKVQFLPVTPTCSFQVTELYAVTVTCASAFMCVYVYTHRTHQRAGLNNPLITSSVTNDKSRPTSQKNLWIYEYSLIVNFDPFLWFPHTSVTVIPNTDILCTRAGLCLVFRVLCGGKQADAGS
jgi:hypothetical protein